MNWQEERMAILKLLFAHCSSSSSYELVSYEFFFFLPLGEDFGRYYYITENRHLFCNNVVRGEDGGWRYSSRKDYW